MSQIRVLQAGRAIAALAVVVFHAGVITEAKIGPIPGWLSALAGLGYLGVDFFFVLSGFIIYFTTRDLRPSPDTAAIFAWRRALRIFLPYWPVGLGLAVAYVLMPGFGTSHLDRGWTWLESVTLIPTNGVPALSVAWTLQHELVFYAIFALGLALGRPLTIVFTWMAAVLAASVAAPELARPLAVVLAPINIEFAFGLLAALLVLSGRPLDGRPAGAVVVLSLALWVILGAERSHSPLVGLAIAVLTLLAVQAERRGRLRVGPGLVALGDASYAIYLIHYPLLSLTTRLAAKLGPEAWPLALLGGVALSVAAGLAYHRLVERPLLRWARGGWRPVAGLGALR